MYLFVVITVKSNIKKNRLPENVASVPHVLLVRKTPNLAEPAVNHTLSGPDSFPGSYSFRLLTGVTRPETPLGSIKALAKATRGGDRNLFITEKSVAVFFFPPFILKMPPDAI